MTFFQTALDQAQLVQHTQIDKEIDLVLEQRVSSVSVAESISLGTLTHRLSCLDRSASLLKGSVVCTSPLAFVQFCGVSPQLLANKPIDLEQLSLEMGRGIQKRTQSDICLATAGFIDKDDLHHDTKVCISFISSKLVRVKKIICTGSANVVASKVAFSALVFLKQLLCRDLSEQ